MASERMTPMAGCSGDRPNPRNVIEASWRTACGSSSTSPTRYWGKIAGSPCRSARDSLETPRARQTRHIRPGSQLDELGAQHARKRGPMCEREADEHARRTAAQRIRDKDKQDDMRDSENQVGKPRHGGIGPAAPERRDEREQQATTDVAAAATSDTPSDTASPLTVRASMSRPIQSVPNGCSQQGARYAAAKSVEMAES